MSKAALLHPVVAEPIGATAQPAVAEAVLVDVVVLSLDDGLFEATRAAVGERNPVWRARSADEAADLLITGRCGVLLLDLGTVSTRADTLVKQIVEQFPEVVVCAAGTRADEPLLVPLITDGSIYRFMHKPCSPRRAGMFLQAAIRRHAERRERGRRPDALAPLFKSLTGSRTRRRRLYLALLAAAALVVTVAFFFGGRPRVATESNAPPLPAPVGGASAEATPRLAPTPHANPVLARARAALEAGRLDSPQGRNALDLYQAVLLAQPDQAEAQQGLARTIDLLLAQANRDDQHGRHQDAEQLVQRVLGVQPDNAQALALARRLTQSDTPSGQLEREQVAAVQPAVTGTDHREQPQQAGVKPPASTARAAGVAPVPVYRTAASTVPATAASAPRAAATLATQPLARADTKPYPDPLVPRTVNRVPESRPASRLRTSSFGAPIENHLPKAGPASAYAPMSTGAPPALARAGSNVPAESPAGAARAQSSDGSREVVAADQFDRVASREPVYPREALRTRTSGWVELEFTITATGTVRDIAVVGAEPTGVFERAASEALAAWRFRPRTVNGQPVAQRSTITMRFDVDI